MNQLFEKFKLNYKNTLDYSVDFFNDNSVAFNNIQHFNTEADLLLFTEVYYGCVNALIQKKQYNKAIDSILKVIPEIETEIDRFNIERSKFLHYKWLIFQEGIAYYYLNDFKTATKLFRYIYKYEPENDSVKSWIEYAKFGKINRYSSYLWILAALGVLTDLLGRGYIPRKISLILIIITFLIFLVTIIIGIYLKRVRRKTK